MNHRLHVGNLSVTTTSTALTEAFARAGHPVVKMSLVMSRDAGISRGFAFLDMASDEAAAAAMAALQGSELDGKQLRVSIANAPKSRFGGSVARPAPLVAPRAVKA